MNLRQHIGSILLVLGFAVALLFPAFYNGYPLVYSDTGTYIHSGFSLEVPHDRPIAYGIFILITSLSKSLWFTVFAQALLISITIYQFIGLFITDTMRKQITFIVNAFVLLVYSGLPWICSTILTEIFSAIAFLLLILLIVDQNRSVAAKVGLGTGIVLLSTTHIANLSTGILYGGVLLVFSFAFRYVRDVVKPLVAAGIVGMFIAGVLLLLVVNQSLGGGFKLAKSSHLFLTGKMIENGILKRYLDNECATQSYQLCAYKDSLPGTSPDFLWDEQNSPMYKLGGWQANEAEYNAILRHIFTTPKYLAVFIRESVVATFKQMTQNNFGEEIATVYKEHSAPHGQINWRFKAELNQFNKAYQNNVGYDLSYFNAKSATQNLLIICAIAFLILLIVLKRISIPMQVSFLLLSLYYVVNASSAAINTFSSRHSSKISWIFILLALIAAMQLWFEYHDYRKERNN